LIHLATERFDGGLILRYHSPMLGHDDDGNPLIYDLEARRVWVGATYPDAAMQNRKTGHGYACVLAERVYYSRSDMPDERVYVIIDEAESATANELFDKIIALKDRYYVSQVIAPDQPIHLSQALQRLEGLTRYQKDMHRAECKARWATFRDKSMTASVRTMAIPHAESAHRGIENILATNARNPDTGEEIVGSDDKPVPRLYLPSNFKNKVARQEITQESMPEVTQAIWLVMAEMERSKPPKPRDEFREERSTNKITGY